MLGRIMQKESDGELKMCQESFFESSINASPIKGKAICLQTIPVLMLLQSLPFRGHPLHPCIIIAILPSVEASPTQSVMAVNSSIVLFNEPISFLSPA